MPPTRLSKYKRKIDIFFWAVRSACWGRIETFFYMRLLALWSYLPITISRNWLTPSSSLMVDHSTELFVAASFAIRFISPFSCSKPIEKKVISRVKWHQCHHNGTQYKRNRFELVFVKYVSNENVHGPLKQDYPTSSRVGSISYLK